MKVEVDPDLCWGYGNCVFHAEDVFELTDATEVAHVLRADVPTERQGAVRAAAEDCPVFAIKLLQPDKAS